MVSCAPFIVNAVWRSTTDPSTLPLRYWDGDVVVYNRLSGDTHILDIVTGEVLRRIAAGEGRGDELRRHIARFLDIPDEEAVGEQVCRILESLDDLGLIEPVHGC